MSDSPRGEGVRAERYRHPQLYSHHRFAKSYNGGNSVIPSGDTRFTRFCYSVLSMDSLRLVCSKCSGGLDVSPEFDWYCHHCEEACIPRLEGVAPGFSEKVLNSFPFPLALTYHLVESPDNAATGLMNLVGVYTSLVRFGALALVSQFLSSDLESPQSAQAVMRLRTPSLDSLHTVLFTLSERLCLSKIPAEAGVGRRIVAANQVFEPRFVGSNGEAREVHAAICEQNGFPSCRR
jgi:hypothetical protein